MDRKAWLVIIICAAGMILNGWWMVNHPPAPQIPLETPSAVESANTASSAPAPVSTVPTAPGAPGAPAPALPAAVAEQTVELKNALATYTFTTRGGGVLNSVLLDTKDHVVLNGTGKAAVGALSSSFKNFEDQNYRIVAQNDSSISFEAELPDKVTVRKDYSFTTGEGSSDHLLNYKLTLTNNSGAKLNRDGYVLYTGAAASLRPDEVEPPAFVWNNDGSADHVLTSKFRDGAGFLGFGGPILDVEHSFPKIRWAGVMSRFYATMISNKEDMPGRIWTSRFLVDHSKSEFKDHPKAHSDYAIHGQMTLPPLELEPGATKSYDLRIYMGAKIFRDLKAIDTADGQPDRQQRDVMFYGMFSFVSRFLVHWLRQFHDWTGNWGIAIVMLTFCVRGILWPVQARSNATMKRMGMLSPKLKELQAKHKDDPQKLNTEMMRLYKEYGVNPLGGCLPMFVQIPIFFGFYSVLRYAAELRGQPFLGWVHDLSMPDTVGSVNLLGYHLDINPLPLLMGLTMFLQMKLTPQPQATDKTQQRIFMFMPFMFLFFCYNFASALALYWTGQNIFSILQAQVTRLWQKDPVLEKVKIAEPAPAPGAKAKKDKPGPPRLGGGGTSSKGKR